MTGFPDWQQLCMALEYSYSIKFDVHKGHISLSQLH